MHSPENECRDEAAGHRFRDAIALQKFDAPGDQRSDEEDNDADREHKKIRRRKFRSFSRQGDVVLVRGCLCTLGKSACRAMYVTVYYTPTFGFRAVAPVA